MMNAMLQRHCAKYIYIVPEGLRELMSDISREVIRSQPEKIYLFVADYLDALMITRENARIALKLVESITEIAETTVQLLIDAGVSREEANRAVTIIQFHFREFIARKPMKKDIEGEDEEEGEMTEMDDFTQTILNELDVDYEKLVEITTIIQNAYRKFKERREREKQMLFGMVDWRVAARSAIRLYKKTGVTHYEANRAATLIKAAYKGYYTRRVMKRLLNLALEAEEVTIESTITSTEEVQDTEILITDDGLSSWQYAEEEEEEEDDMGLLQMPTEDDITVPKSDTTTTHADEVFVVDSMHAIAAFVEDLEGDKGEHDTVDEYDEPEERAADRSEGVDAPPTSLADTTMMTEQTATEEYTDANDTTTTLADTTDGIATDTTEATEATDVTDIEDA